MNIIDINKLENVVQHHGYYTAGCPICILENGDSKKCHLSVLDDGKFNCIKYSNDKEHNKQILQVAGTEIDSIPIIIKQPKIKLNQIWSPDILIKLFKDHSYWNNRGIPDEIIEPFGGGMAITNGKLKDRYVFPCYNENMEIVMLTGRWTKKEYNTLRWKHLGNKNSIYLFPHFAREDIIKNNKIIILESIADCLMLRKYKINYGIVIFGLRLSSKLMRFLIESSLNNIIISTNNDVKKNNAGNKAAEEIKNILLNFFDESKIHIILPKSKDWGESNESDIIELKEKLDKLI